MHPFPPATAARVHAWVCSSTSVTASSSHNSVLKRLLLLQENGQRKSSLAADAGDGEVDRSKSDTFSGGAIPPERDRDKKNSILMRNEGRCPGAIIFDYVAPWKIVLSRLRRATIRQWVQPGLGKATLFALSPFFTLPSLPPTHTLCTVQIIANSSRQSRDNEKALHLYENVVKMKTCFQSWHSLTSTLHESARKPFSTSHRCWSWHFKSPSLCSAFKSSSPEKMGANCHNVWFTHFENIWCRTDYKTRLI